MDNDGNVVVVNMASTSVLTFSPAGKLLKTEQAASRQRRLGHHAGRHEIYQQRPHGRRPAIRPGRPAELIATGIPSAASMCYDKEANQLVIPMNANNALAFMKL